MNEYRVTRQPTVGGADGGRGACLRPGRDSSREARRVLPTITLPLEAAAARSSARLGSLPSQYLRRAIALSVLLTAHLVAPLSTPAQVTVDFVVPAEIEIATGSNGDLLIFESGVIQTTEVGTCGEPGTFPVQQATLAHGGVPIPLTVIVTSSSTEITPWTALSDLTFLGECAISGALYHGYQGTVD